MDEYWFSNIEGIVFTFCKHELSGKPGARHPELFCTSSDTNDLPPKFPALMVREITQEEIGQDLDNATVNAVRSTFECKVYAKTEDECRDISVEQTAVMKSMRFNALTLPIFTEEGGVHRSVSRYRRVIGYGEI